MEVGAQNSGEVFVHHHSAVHLAELKQAICCERNIKFETISTRSEDVFCISHANEGAQTASDNHVQCNAERCARGSHLQSGGNTVLVFCCAWIKLRWLHGSPSITCSLQAAFCVLVRLRLQFVSTFQVYGFVAGACSDGLVKTGFSPDDWVGCSKGFSPRELCVLAAIQKDPRQNLGSECLTRRRTSGRTNRLRYPVAARMVPC